MVVPLKNILERKGVSLLEMIIAMSIITIFGTVLLTGIGGNVFRSEEMRAELKMVELLELKINELIIDPPKFRKNLLEELTDEKEFEDFPGYTYSIKMHPFMFSEYLAALGQGPESEDFEDGGELYRRIYNLVSKNLQKMVWQVEVTVTHTESQRSQSVSTLLHNRDANIEWSGMFVTKGFSLIEVMISLVLLAFLMMGAYVMVDNSQRTKDSVTVEDRTMLQAQMALNRLEADFSQLYSPAYFVQEKKEKRAPVGYQATEQFPRMTGEGQIVPLLEQSDDSTLVFMTSSNRRKMRDIKAIPLGLGSVHP